MHEFKHPNYYKELRKRNKAARIPPTSSGQAAADQAISSRAETSGTSVRPDPGLKLQAREDSTVNRVAEPQASSVKPQATSIKLEATSVKLLDS